MPGEREPASTRVTKDPQPSLWSCEATPEDTPKLRPPFDLNPRTVILDVTRTRYEDTPQDGRPFKGDKRGAQRRVRGITALNPCYDQVSAV